MPAYLWNRDAFLLRCLRVGELHPHPVRAGVMIRPSGEGQGTGDCHHQPVFNACQYSGSGSVDRSRRDFCSILGTTAFLASSMGAFTEVHAASNGGKNPHRMPQDGQQLKIRLLMNSALSGPHAFFCLAHERGYFAEAGLDVEFVPGDGAASVVPRIPQEGFDGGYGDLNALIKLAALRPDNCPVAVHVAFNQTPLTVGVRRESSIHSPKDLEGRVIGGHPIDAAIEAFPAYAMVAGVDESRVSILRSNASMATLAEDVLNGHADGVFGFVHTIIAALAGKNIDGRAGLRFLEYRDVVPELYGNALMLTPAFLQQHPDAARALVAALNRGIIETLADPQAALEATRKRSPKFAQHVDGPRLMGTLNVEMAHPEGERIGIGDVDDGRLQRSIDLLVESCRLPRTPRPEDVFTRAYLPPLEQRARPVAQVIGGEHA